MKIQVNKKDFEVLGERPSVADLLEQMAPRHPVAAVKVNGAFVRRGEYGTNILKGGDRVIVVHMLGGG
jgi:thiamine biosynthesis protein ThiS